MQGVVIHKDGPLVRDLPEPTMTEGQVRVRIHMSAITGLDLDVVHQRMPFSGIPGSTFVGTVDQGMGPAAKAMVGRRVVGRGSFGCGDCEACHSGADYRCVDRRRPGVSAVSGAHAQFIFVPHHAVVPLPDGISDESSVLLPLLATAYSAVIRAELPDWTNILIIGDGGMGLLAALAYSAAGYTVTVRGKHGNRFDLLRRHNIHFNLVTDEPEVRGARPGRFGPALVHYPYVIEATGSASGWDAALALVSPGGTVFLLSSCADRVPRPLAAVQDKNVRVVGLREGPIEAALAIVGNGWFDPADVITNTYALEDAPKAYKKALHIDEWIPVLRMP